MIEINNLSFARGNFLVFKDVSFTVNPGEILILRGPNGKGKTTLLSNIIQLLDHISGEIKYQESKVDSYIASQCFLYLGENHFAYDQLSLGQNIDYWLSIHNVTFNKAIRDQSIRYLFGELNLNKKFYQLSFGQKKKLQLLLMDSRKDFGLHGMKMELKSPKGSLVMVKEIAFGPLGTKMVTKNFKLPTRMEN